MSLNRKKFIPALKNKTLKFFHFPIYFGVGDFFISGLVPILSFIREKQHLQNSFLNRVIWRLSKKVFLIQCSLVNLLANFSCPVNTLKYRKKQCYGSDAEPDPAIYLNADPDR
jgi:hypothetical protein